MKAPSTQLRFSEAQKLLDYGFSNYSYIQFAKKDSILCPINVTKGVSSVVNGVYAEDSGTLMQKGTDKNVEQVISVPDTIQAPVFARSKNRRS